MWVLRKSIRWFKPSKRPFRPELPQVTVELSPPADLLLRSPGADQASDQTPGLSLHLPRCFSVIITGTGLLLVINQANHVILLPTAVSLLILPHNKRVFLKMDRRWFKFLYCL